jgi:V-type H+-transporting ATPase subunit D
MTAAVRVASRTDNIAGVKLPVFSQRDTGVDLNRDNLGLLGGGRKIVACREKFSEYLKALIRLASLQTAFLAMDEALKVTNRRVNALENVTIPAIVAVVDMINRYSEIKWLTCKESFWLIFLNNDRELDELEREDFTRLKKVQAKKIVKMAAEELDR